MTEEEAWLSIGYSEGRSVCAEFLKSGGDPNYTNSDFGTSLLHQACEHGNLDLLELLIKSGANTDFVPGCGYPAIFQALDIDIDGAIQSGGPIELTTAKKLVECGASLDVKYSDGRTPQEYCVGYGRPAKEAYEVTFPNQCIEQVAPSKTDSRLGDL